MAKPAPCGAHQHVGHHRLGRHLVEGEAGFGVERLELGHHLGEILGVDAAQLDQRRGVAARQQRQVVDQRAHRRVEAVAIGELQRQAFGEMAGEHARRIEALHQRQRRLDPRHGAIEPVCDIGELALEVAGLVDHVDEMRADDAVDGVGDVDRELRQQMVAQGGGPAQRLVEPGQHLAGLRPPQPALPGGGIAGKVEIALALAACRLLPALDLFGVGCGGGLGGLGGALGRRVVALQQRVLLELALDEGRELHVGELQQLDRLLQLRRHDERLGVAEIEPLGKRHGVVL